MLTPKTFTTRNGSRFISITLLAISAIMLIGLEYKVPGWLFWSAGLISLSLCQKNFRNHIALIYLSLALLGLIPISTDITNENILRMGSVLLLALSLPYFLERKFAEKTAISFPFHHGRKWYKKEVAYIVITAVIAYLVLPFYFQNTGAYLNWSVDNTFASIGRLFIGTNALGIWDELFFISTVLAILRLHLPFWQANGLQAVLFTSFLYDLGFVGWAPYIIYPFALTQGYIFKKTDSLLYIITIHLTLDFVLFLALINAHHPHLVDIFIT